VVSVDAAWLDVSLEVAALEVAASELVDDCTDVDDSAVEDPGTCAVDDSLVGAAGDDDSEEGGGVVVEDVGGQLGVLLGGVGLVEVGSVLVGAVGQVGVVDGVVEVGPPLGEVVVVGEVVVGVGVVLGVVGSAGRPGVTGAAIPSIGPGEDGSGVTPLA
jgi:hypothetical protein